jgi:hypothetical protein
MTTWVTKTSMRPGYSFSEIEGVLGGEGIEDEEAGLAEEFADSVDQRGFIVDEQDSSAFE